MNRRQFLASLGVAAGALALNGLPLPAAPDTAALDTIFTRGDIITFDGVFAVNPYTRRVTPYLQQFVVTEVTSGGCAFHPRPIVAGPYRNVSAAPDLERVRPLLTGQVVA